MIEERGSTPERTLDEEAAAALLQQPKLQASARAVRQRDNIGGSKEWRPQVQLMVEGLPLSALHEAMMAVGWEGSEPERHRGDFGDIARGTTPWDGSKEAAPRDAEEREALELQENEVILVSCECGYPECSSYSARIAPHGDGWLIGPIWTLRQEGNPLQIPALMIQAEALEGAHEDAAAAQMDPDLLMLLPTDQEGWKPSAALRELLGGEDPLALKARYDEARDRQFKAYLAEQEKLEQERRERIARGDEQPRTFKRWSVLRDQLEERKKVSLRSRERDGIT